MSKYALVKETRVDNVIEARDEDFEVLQFIFPESLLVKIDENTLGIPSPGGTYQDGRFYLPKPHDNWIHDDSINRWLPPIPYPNDGAIYVWNQEDTAWVKVTPPTDNE